MYAMRPQKIPSTLSTKVHENKSLLCRQTVLTEYSSKAVPQHEAMGTAMWDVKCHPSCGMSGALVVACEAGARHRKSILQGSVEMVILFRGRGKS